MLLLHCKHAVFTQIAHYTMIKIMCFLKMILIVIHKLFSFYILIMIPKEGCRVCENLVGGAKVLLGHSFIHSITKTIKQHCSTMCKSLKRYNSYLQKKHSPKVQANRCRDNAKSESKTMSGVPVDYDYSTEYSTSRIQMKTLILRAKLILNFALTLWQQWQNIPVQWGTSLFLTYLVIGS